MICQHEEMVTASGVRISWTQIPAWVRAGIEAIIGGGAVVTAVSQSGGFSPGTADRVVTADGRRAFVKAVSSMQNERSPSCTGLRPRSSVNSHPIPTSRRYSASTTMARGSGWCLKTSMDAPQSCRGTPLSSRLP